MLGTILNPVFLSYVLSTTLGLVCLKLGSASGAPVSFVEGRIHLNIGAYVITGFLLYGASFIIYTYLIAKNDLSYIIPVSTALVYVGIFLASFFIFKETFTAVKVLGILLIIGGVVLLNLK